jgi:hypothetical protein
MHSRGQRETSTKLLRSTSLVRPTLMDLVGSAIKVEVVRCDVGRRQRFLFSPSVLASHAFIMPPATPSTDTSPCSIERRCSSTGRLCARDSRSCQDEAIASGLEITCERNDGSEYVYCPPGASQRDSGVVWLLLVVAMAIALIGGAVSWRLFRQRLGSGDDRSQAVDQTKP